MAVTPESDASELPPPRRRPPVWLAVVVAVLLGAIAWLRLEDRTGDAGITNFLTLVLGAIVVLLVLGWFALLSGVARRRRLGVLLVVVGALGAFHALFRVRHYSGSLVPRFTLRFVDDAEPPPPPARHAPAGVDLASTTPDDFPGFLGPRRDGAVEHVRLARDWRARPPQRLWRRRIGSGWSGFAVVNGCAVTLEQRGGTQAVSARDVTTGELLWYHDWPGRFTHVLGGAGPRSTPLIHDGRVYALGVDGLLLCLDGADGSVIWQRDLLADYGVSPEQERNNVQYGRSNSPVIADGRLIVPAGGNPGGRQSNLSAYDPLDGSVLWEGSPRQISFSSPRHATLAGVEQILIVNESSVSGHDLASGRMLWEHDRPGRTSADANVSQAVPVPPDRVLVSKGYGLGAALLRLLPDPAGGLAVEVLWQDPRLLRTKFTNVVIHRGHVYGLSEGILECVALDSGTRAWKAGRYGHGQILRVGDVLLVLSEDGEVVLVELDAGRPNAVLGRFQALEGQTWNHIALYGDLLAIRNGYEAAVYRLPLASDDAG